MRTFRDGTWRTLRPTCAACFLWLHQFQFGSFETVEDELHNNNYDDDGDNALGDRCESHLFANRVVMINL
jgi:hypothetical protein